MDALGTTTGSFIGLLLVIFGGAALLTGQSLARAWEPAWKTVPYAVLLAVGCRFLDYALFGADARSVPGVLAATAILWALTYLAFRVVRAGRMVRQYPWLYERAGPFGWRERTGPAGR